MRSACPVISQSGRKEAVLGLDQHRSIGGNPDGGKGMIAVRPRAPRHIEGAAERADIITSRGFA
jgi:hypothetical protein